MKCIGLFKALICMAILNSGTQSPLKMLSDSILYCSNFKIFHFQHYYSNNCTTPIQCCAIVRGVHNSRTVHRMCTKFDARICLWTPFLCAKFQGDRSTCLRFIAIFSSVRKHNEKKKTKKKIETLAAHISEMAGTISFKFGM